jgi:hypothetical protein
MYHDCEQQPHGVNYDVALASFNQLPRIEPTGPPFSVVFTDWLSMMAALGVGSRPASIRVRSRSASWMRSSVPFLLHRLKNP